MASSQRDTSPNMGSKKSVGMKNNDGREGPQEAAKPAFKDKAVNNMPNEGAPELSGKGVIAKLI